MDDIERIKLELKKLLDEKRKLKHQIRCRNWRERQMKKNPNFKKQESKRHHQDYLEHKPEIIIKSTSWRHAHRERFNQLHRNHYWNKKLGVRWKP